MSAIPDAYYYTFGVYEPLLTFLGFAGVLVDPRAVSSPFHTAALPLNTLIYLGARLASDRAWP